MSETRWKNYRKANDSFPEVRRNELEYMLDIINAKAEEIIVEAGTGNGYLTFPLAEGVGKSGKILTYDIVLENLDEVNKTNKIHQLSIETRAQKDTYEFQEADSTVDKVVSIASFHHYDTRTEGSGFSGRLRALMEFNRILKDSGHLFIADVGKETVSATYFNAIDNPQYCFPNGHPHDFLSKEEIYDLCEKANFRVVQYETRHVPWIFTTIDEAKEFLHTIHNARCTPEESFELAKKNPKL